MHIIGLLGGVASGKSLVAQELARRGAVVLDADRAGHEALRLPQVEAAARHRWGAKVFGPDGHVDRPKLAQIVFAPPPKGGRERRYLEQLTHPEIGRLLQQQIDAIAPGTPLVVLDAALLFEAGWDKLCERLVFVDAPREVRRARALARGWTEDEFAAREDAQESLDFKYRRADVIIDNSGSPDHTQSQVERLWQFLVG